MKSTLPRVLFLLGPPGRGRGGDRPQAHAVITDEPSVDAARTLTGCVSLQKSGNLSEPLGLPHRRLADRVLRCLCALARGPRQGPGCDDRQPRQRKSQFRGTRVLCLDSGSGQMRDS